MGNLRLKAGLMTGGQVVHKTEERWEDMGPWGNLRLKAGWMTGGQGEHKTEERWEDMGPWGT